MRISVQWLTGNDNKPKGLWPIEWLAITYSILTTLAMFVLWPDMDHPRDMLADRLYIFLGTILLWRIYLFWPRRLMTFIRITAQMALLSYWYPDTYEFNRTFPNLDHIFARWDAVLFSCQPSLELPMALVFRSRKYGLFLLLSHDCGRHGFLLSLSQ